MLKELPHSRGFSEEHSSFSSPNLRNSSSMTSTISALNNAMIASTSSSFSGEEEIDLLNDELNNCVLMSDEFDVKAILNLPTSHIPSVHNDDGQDSFAESVILNIPEESNENKNDTFDDFVGDLNVSETDCSYGSLALFENLSNCIDALVASSGSADFRGPAPGYESAQLGLNPRSSVGEGKLPGFDESHSRFEIIDGMDDPSASVLQTSISVVQPVFSENYIAHDNSKNSSDNSSSNMSLLPPTSLSESVEYQSGRMALSAALPMPPVTSAAVASYLDYESSRPTEPLTYPKLLSSSPSRPALTSHVSSSAQSPGTEPH